jgi:hypothetical protein
VRIPPAFSTYLDLVRAACAIAVVYHHYSNHIVKAFPRVFPNVGQEAVMVFFVLSGFVISHVARRTENDPVVFATKRVARIYPVAIAGVVLSYLLYALCAPMAPGLYDDRVSSHGWLTEVTLTLSFLNQTIWFPYAMPPANGPYWSLTCEVWFYVLATAMFFAPRRLSLLAIAFAFPILGPKIMLLFPVWLFGAGAERLCDRRRISQRAAGALLLLSLAAAVGPVASDARDAWRVSAAAAEEWRLGRTSDFVYYNLLGLLVGINFFAAYNFFLAGPFRLARGGTTRRPPRRRDVVQPLRHALPDPLRAPELAARRAVSVLLPDRDRRAGPPLRRPIENLRVPAYRLLRTLASRVRLLGRRPVLDPIDHFP